MAVEGVYLIEEDEIRDWLIWRLTPIAGLNPLC